ncbi:unnamed protein product [Aphanomyces euteiches]
MSGPGGRNRLDYIYIDETLVALFHSSSSFHANKYHGDHLTHTATLSVSQASAVKPQRKLWRLPRELLLNPKVTLAIKIEAQTLLDELNQNPNCNAGAKWSGWLKRMCSHLKQCHHNRQKYRYRLFGKGWYNHKKSLQRIDLDIAAKEKKLVSPFATASGASGQATRPTSEAKRQ